MRLREKIGYGLGDTASSMFWKLFGVYLMYFYTDMCGMDAAVVGTMFLVTRIWDSFFDPVVGIVADRTETRWGKFRPYLLWFAVPFGLMGVLTFTSPDFSAKGQIVYTYVVYSLMMMVYSLINVPYATLMGVMSPDPLERTSLSSFRMAFAAGGSILSLLLIEPLVKLFGGEEAGAGSWTAAVAVLAVIAAGLFFCTFAWTRERVRPVRAKRNPLRDDIRDLLRNVPWWVLLCAGVCVLIFNSIREGGSVYYFKYYADVPAEGLLSGAVSAATLYLVLGQAANIAGIILMPYATARMGKKRMFIAAMGAVSLLSVAFYFLNPGAICAMMVLQVLISLCAGGILPLLWSMYADVSDYSEWATGRRATGLIFSSSSMSQKLGWSLGGAVTGWLLFLFGFEANVVQGETAREGIRLMLSILPAAGALLSMTAVAFYSLGDRKMERIERELAERRERC